MAFTTGAGRPAKGCVRFLALLSIVFLLGCLRAGSSEPADGDAPNGATVRGRIAVGRYYFDLAEKEVEYSYYVPTAYDPERRTPLVILLHGLTSSPQQVIRYQGVTEQAEKRGYIVVAPFGYNERGWYGSMGPGRPSLGLRGRASNASDPENIGALSEQDVWNVLVLARERFNVDPERIYLMGHSMGGGGSFHLAMRRPDVWAAVAPLSPAIYGDPSRVRAMRALPVIVVQGERDRLVPAANTRRWIAQMEQLGMQLRYVEIPGGDHVRSIASNPAIIGQVFDFFDAHTGAGGGGAHDGG